MTTTNQLWRLFKRLAMALLRMLIMMLRKYKFYSFLRRHLLRGHGHQAQTKADAQRELHGMFIHIATEIKWLIGPTAFNRLLKTLLYDNKKALQVVDATKRQWRDNSAKAGRHHERPAPDRRTETFRKLGKVAQGVSPPQ